MLRGRAASKQLAARIGDHEPPPAARLRHRVRRRADRVCADAAPAARQAPADRHALPVTDIALASGFRACAASTRCSRTRYRMPPSRLRREPRRPTLPDRCWRSSSPTGRRTTGSDARLSCARAPIAGVERGRRERLLAARWRSTPRRRRAPAVSRCDARRASRAVASRVSPSLARAVPPCSRACEHAFDSRAIRWRSGAARRARGGASGVARSRRLRRFRARGARDRRPADLGARGANAARPVGHGVRRQARAGRCAGGTRLFPSADAARRGRSAGHRARRADRRTRPDAARLAKAVARGDVDLRPGAGVGRHVARRSASAARHRDRGQPQYIAMRALGWPDAFPADDLVVLKAMGETRPSRAMARSEAWRPWRAYAVMHLWKGH